MQQPFPLPGDLVWIRRKRWRVERVRRDRHVVCLDVAARDRRLTFLSPFDRVFTMTGASSPRRVRPQEALARLAHLIARAGDVRVPSVMVAASAEILPYQLEPAMAMLAGRPRVLIADEVGLGKTIQAGLIIAELALRDAGVRILVLTPASLRDQWQDELRRRFDLDCIMADREGLDALARASAFGDNPWHRPGIWIASADFLKQRHVVSAVPRDPWDLLVVDEAHAVCGNSDRYDLVQQIALRSRRVLLLTATPHSGDQARFEKLISIGTGSGPALLLFRRTRALLGAASTRRVRWHRVGLSAIETSVLRALRAYELAVLKRSAHDEKVILLLSVLRKRALSSMWALSESIGRRIGLLDHYSSDSVEFTQRRLCWEDGGDPADVEERDGLTAASGLPEKQELPWLRRLRGLAQEAARHESKIRRLLALIRRAKEPVVVFTEFTDSLDAIRRRLPVDTVAAVLHGSQDDSERRQQLRSFLQGPATVLLATDVAGQGLNLQSRSRWVISLELPWNPARLEQRIGRVDRISQQRGTHLTLLVARDDAESGLLAHLSRRILTAHRAVGTEVLASVAPPEDAVRRAVLLQSALLDTQAPPTLASCRSWARPALRVAAAFLRRRALANFWRASTASSSAAAWCSHGAATRLIPAGARSLFVFSVPIVDAGDQLVQRIVIPIATSADVRDKSIRRIVIESLRQRAIAAARRRTAAIKRRRRAALQSATTREMEIAAANADEISDRELQPGLFDHRDERAFEAEQRDVADAQRITDQLLEREALAGDLRAGEPTLELLLSRDR